MRDPAHPIETQDYVVPTPAAETALRAVARWVRNGLPGGCIIGLHRVGKSWAIDYGRANLKGALDFDVPSCLFCCDGEQDGIRETGHYQWLLADDGIDSKLLRGTKTQLKRRLLERLVGKVRESGQNRLVLFFDDAQNLTIEQFAWLSGLFNRLKRFKVRPTFVLVGEPGLNVLRTSFLAAKKQQTVARFMVLVHDYHGIRSKKELMACLKSYDQRAFYPADSEISYTQHYFPAAFAEGWRLESLGDALWERLTSLRAEAGLGDLTELTMATFTLVVEILLKAHGDADVIKPRITKDDLDAALEESGYVESEYRILDKEPEEARADA